MMTSIRSDKIILPEGIFDGYVCMEHGKITGVVNEVPEGTTVYDMKGRYVSPGFIEMHSHGAGGNAFLSEDPYEIAKGCDFHLAHGTTTILPTVSASPLDDMKRAALAIGAARDGKLSKANILGAHLEGPYLSKNQCGAQCTDYITPPVRQAYESLIDECGDAVSRWTYAPENDENGEFCDYIVNKGVLLSAGHTDAEYPDVYQALAHGCKLITHLYSCTSTVTRNKGFRSLGVIESAFLLDGMYVELIADGKHLPRELVQMIVKIKGADRVVLTTDSLEIAGTDIKEGVMAGTSFIVEDGVCKLRDRSAFAGSVATSDVLLRFAALECGFGVEKTVKMMSENPAFLLGLNKGKLCAGYDADVTVFNEDLYVTDVFVGGEKVV